MENMIRRHTHTCIANSHPHSPSLTMHKDSHTISKTKPNKIRIIHIFPPEIIKTDVENFRELVQRLTGKTSGEKCCNKKTPIRITGRREQESIRSTTSSGSSGVLENPTKRTELRNIINGGFWGLDHHTMDRVKEEVGAGRDESSGGGYLGGFSDLEGFISEFGEFPLFPLDDTHMQGFEAHQLL